MMGSRVVCVKFSKCAGSDNSIAEEDVLALSIGPRLTVSFGGLL